MVPVILFHAGFSWFRGGYVGVDVFFVISGYRSGLASAAAAKYPLLLQNRKFDANPETATTL